MLNEVVGSNGAKKSGRISAHSSEFRDEVTKYALRNGTAKAIKRWPQLKPQMVYNWTSKARLKGKETTTNTEPTITSHHVKQFPPTDEYAMFAKAQADNFVLREENTALRTVIKLFFKGNLI